MAGAASSIGMVKGGGGGGATASGAVCGQIGQAAQVAGETIAVRLDDADAGGGQTAAKGGDGAFAQPATFSMTEAIKPIK